MYTLQTPIFIYTDDGYRSLSPASLNTSHSSTEDVSMETVEDEETKRAKRVLEMVSLWVCHTIR